MKNKLFTILIFGLLFTLSNNVLANGDHNDMDMQEAADHCTTPTTEITITGGENQALAYDNVEYQVPKNTCIEVIFVNAAIIEHDVSIDDVEGVMEEVHLHLENNTDGHDLDGVISMYILTPDEDTEFEIYCSVPGHKEGGMFATLLVGEGNTSLLPGFLFISLFLSMSIMIIIVKKRNN